MKHSLQFKRKDTGEVFLISSKINDDEKTLIVAIVDEMQEKGYRETDVEIYQQIEN